MIAASEDTGPGDTEVEAVGVVGAVVAAAVVSTTVVAAAAGVDTVDVDVSLRLDANLAINSAASELGALLAAAGDGDVVVDFK